MANPIINECFADNGAHSHWAVIDANTGECLVDVIPTKQNRQYRGSWAASDIRRIFVAGAKWWEFYKTGATMWNSDRDLAEIEATKRYGDNNGKTDQKVDKSS
jgi:hypothetical protein